jgi:hypothetical protein
MIDRLHQVNQATLTYYPVAAASERRCAPAVLPALVLLATQLPGKGEQRFTYEVQTIPTHRTPADDAEGVRQSSLSLPGDEPFAGVSR